MMTNRRPRVRNTLATAMLAGLLLSVPGVRAERIPGTCEGFLYPGPTQVSCSFTHQGRSLFAFAVVANDTIGRNETIFGSLITPNAASIRVDIVRADDPTFHIAHCSFDGETDGTIPPLFAGPCFFPEQPTLADNTPLICRARGTRYAIFGCLSTTDLDPIPRPSLPGVTTSDR